MRGQKTGTFRKGWGLRAKLVMLLLLVGLIPFLANAIIDQLASADALTARAAAQLESIREIKKGQIASYIQERSGDTEVLARIVQSLRREGIAKLKAIEGTKVLKIRKTTIPIKRNAIRTAIISWL